MKPRILLAEIDEAVREDWASALERARFEVEQSQSPRESLYRFCIQTPDLMILSLEGPVADGLKTLELMRNFSPSCPLLIVSAEAEQYVSVPRAGKELVLKKPVDGPGLVKAVKTLVQPLAVQQMETGGEMVEVELPPNRKRRSSGGRHYTKRAPVISRNDLQHC